MRYGIHERKNPEISDQHIEGAPEWYTILFFNSVEFAFWFLDIISGAKNASWILFRSVAPDQIIPRVPRFYVVKSRVEYSSGAPLDKIE